MTAASPIRVIVEVPKGSRNRYEWDEALGAIKLDRFLFSSHVYPTDYGFVPRTVADDGDPLDAIVCVAKPTFPGCVIPAKVIALFRLCEASGRDDKLRCVPCADPEWSGVEELDDLDAQLREEITHFFSIYRKPEGRQVTAAGWRTRDEALRVLAAAHARYEDRAS